MVTLKTWQARMSEDMRLRDFRPRTQEGYLAAVRQFMDWVKKAPAALADDDVRAYFLYLRETKKLAPSSINVAVYAMRFFFIHTMNREWKVFEVLRVHKQRLLPVVLSPAEVRQALQANNALAAVGATKGSTEIDFYGDASKKPPPPVKIIAKLAPKQFSDLEKAARGQRMMVRGQFWEMNRDVTEVEVRDAVLFEDRDWYGAMLADPNVIAACPAAINELTGVGPAQPGGFKH
mgnify:CR=1 FL=1